MEERLTGTRQWSLPPHVGEHDVQTLFLVAFPNGAEEPVLSDVRVVFVAVETRQVVRVKLPD